MIFALGIYDKITAGELLAGRSVAGTGTINPAGEVGAIGSPPAVINAVVDALRDYGVRHIEMPATPAKIWSIINAGGAPQQPRMAAA